MGMELTARQQEIYDFLRERRDGAGICPSHEEIRHHFGFRSSNAAQDHLNAMEKKGWIKRDPGKARSIHLI